MCTQVWRNKAKLFNQQMNLTQMYIRTQHLCSQQCRQWQDPTQHKSLNQSSQCLYLWKSKAVLQHWHNLSLYNWLQVLEKWSFRLIMFWCHTFLDLLPRRFIFVRSRARRYWYWQHSEGRLGKRNFFRCFLSIWKKICTGRLILLEVGLW